ncbi:hypothetical protein UFOVP1071_56 [uncultured Caudovirales phage]|uniref:Uncharacterized protein n=1 Tax=uncultured Caudovirales phage TaxID=2100421 RepID=A0A6J5QQ09_9CAUD|nr:hypothetical protein UFOVP1071_56 [uncultured Caudovirales phage]
MVDYRQVGSIHRPGPHVTFREYFIDVDIPAARMLGTNRYTGIPPVLSTPAVLRSMDVVLTQTTLEHHPLADLLDTGLQLNHPSLGIGNLDLLAEGLHNHVVVGHAGEAVCGSPRKSLHDRISVDPVYILILSQIRNNVNRYFWFFYGDSRRRGRRPIKLKAILIEDK